MRCAQQGRLFRIISLSIIVPFLVAVFNREMERFALETCVVEPNGGNRSWAGSIRVECFVENGGRVWREAIGGPVAELHVWFCCEEAADG